MKRYAHSRIPVHTATDETTGQPVITGHVARSNDHWRTWKNSPLTLCVIDGADAYVTPKSYTSQPAVPTWNYSSATVTGHVTVAEDTDKTREDLLDLLAALEPEQMLGEAELAYYDKLLPGIVGFRLAVRSCTYKEKVRRAPIRSRPVGYRAHS